MRCPNLLQSKVQGFENLGPSNVKTHTLIENGRFPCWSKLCWRKFGINGPFPVSSNALVF